MRAGSLALLTLLLIVLPSTLRAASASAPAAAPAMQEAFLLNRGPDDQLRVLEAVSFPPGTKGPIGVGLFRGFQNLQVVQGPADLSLDERNSTLVVPEPPPRLEVSYQLDSNDPYLALRLPMPEALSSLALLAGKDVYPVPITNNQINPAGETLVQGQPYMQFVAGNIPAGTDFIVGLTLGVPGRGAAAVVRVLTVVLGLGGLGAAFWFRSRLGSMV